MEIQVQLLLQFINSQCTEAAYMELNVDEKLGQEISNLLDAGSIFLSVLAKWTAVNSTPLKHRALNLATECNFIVLRLLIEMKKENVIWLDLMLTLCYTLLWYRIWVCNGIQLGGCACFQEASNSEVCQTLEESDS